MTSKLIFYFLPEPTIHGGIKVGFQFSELLRQLGIDVVMATPDGGAPQWFPTQIPIGSRESILPNLTPRDRVIFSLPYDYDELKQSGAKLIFHCQGTDEAIVPILKDDILYVFSDGFADQFGGPDGKKYKLGNFKKTLQGLNNVPIHEQGNALDDIIEGWRKGLMQVDDILVIGVKI